MPWILENGSHCCNSGRLDPDFREIGNPDLIQKRASRRVPIAPGGTLTDYVPFYFTPLTPMLLNIKTGWNGLKRTPMPDIAVLVTSLHKLLDGGHEFVFTDRHAYVAAAQFFRDLGDLARVDWELLRARDFRRDPDDPGKCERYQAEALPHRAVPTSALLAIACHGPAQKARVEQEASNRSIEAKVVVKRDWYF